MPNQQQACFDEIQFNRFLEDKAEPKEEARIIGHIETCKDCQTALEALAGHQQVWSDIKQHLAEGGSLQGDETHEHMELRDRQRDLKKIQELLGPTDNPEMLGRVGSYEVCGMIGRGSAGVVVKALDTRLNRFVAIKLLAPVYSNNGSSRRRFEREGRAIASVKDPNVIPVHTVGEFRGTPYIVMQYVPDGSLDQRIEKKGPLNTREVVCVGMQIAKGLAAAHERGIVHRDVKPANVLLEGGVDCAMVTDFGLARVVDEATMTRSGAISGTPQYMSPEQAKGELVDPRSDLFSLGSVMYAACTGHSPFRAESVFGVIKRVCDSEPRSLRESNPEISAWLEAFVSKLHSKNIENRFDSASQVAELLSKELAHLQAPTLVPQPAREWWNKPKRVPRTSRRGWQLGIGSAVASAGLTIGLLSWSGFGNPGSTDPGGPPPVANVSPVGSPEAQLALATQENEELEEFENSVETTIDVQNGGVLFFRSNLGRLNVTTHDKPTVEMKLTHSVKAKDKETASGLFKAVQMAYDLDHEVAAGVKLNKKKDALIVAEFPTQKLSDEEIEAAEDFDELKKQLLVRNNSHFSNAEFELMIPKEFSLNLSTKAGPIYIGDITGDAKLMTQGGHIVAGNVSGMGNFESHGGHIEVADVAGKFVAHTRGGHIHAQTVKGTTDVKTLGGNIEITHAVGQVKAISMGGGIRIWKVESEVNCDCPAGKIDVCFVKQPQGDSVIKAGAGSVRIGYTEGLSFDIEAQSGLGHVRGPFVDGKPTTFEHQLNSGGYKLVASTGTGSISFRVVDVEELDAKIAERVEAERGEKAFQFAYDLHMDGEIDKAIEAHRIAAGFEAHKILATYNLGCAWALKGETDKAFAALGQAIEFGLDDLEQLKFDGDLNSLRADKRFEEILAQMTESDNLGRVESVVGREMSETEREARALGQNARKFRDRGNFEEAEKAYQALLEFDPKSSDAILHMGYVIHSQGRHEEAYPWHEQATQTKGTAGLGYYNMACVHSLKKEVDQAIKHLELAIENGFAQSDHMKRDSDLDNIRKDDRFQAILKSLKKLKED
ncbi:MAG: serine/threonine protein kinase/tetratricopeptide (TPR) repeat protein [Mariniblastus sp.]|jgi:serine/threonine protein kinase/tetratricopeptide (TPR) repeat protein